MVAGLGGGEVEEFKAAGFEAVVVGEDEAVDGVAAVGFGEVGGEPGGEGCAVEGSDAGSEGCVEGGGPRK